MTDTHSAPAARRRRPAKAQSLALAPTTGVADAFGQLVRNCLQQMRANETGVLHGRNPEYLHQYRVGLRRLRSALHIYRPLFEPAPYATIDDALRRLAGTLGPARDWDVFIGETVRPLMRCEPQAAGLAALHRRSAAERRRQISSMRDALNAPDHADLMIGIEQYATAPAWRADEDAQDLLGMPLPAFAASRIAQREKRLRKRVDNLAAADAAQRHRVRIAAKKLRYAIALFAALFERKTLRRHQMMLSALQDVLGKLNDCATARRLLEALPAGRGKAAGATALLIDWIAVQEQHALAALDLVCRDWRALEPFAEAAALEASSAAT